MIRQRTLKTSVRATGVGLHTGQKVMMALRPAPIDSGIVFCRSDLPGNPSVRAHALNVSNTMMATVIEKDGARVSTVEHLMSAFAGLGIDNAFVDVSAEEVPIMDGSAGTFVFLIQSAGIEEQAAAKRYIRVLKTVELEQGDKRVRLEPFDGFKIAFSIEFDHPVFDPARSHVEIDFGDVSFVREMARAPGDRKNCRDPRRAPVWRPGDRLPRHPQSPLPADCLAARAARPAVFRGARPALRLRARPLALIGPGDALERVAQRRIGEAVRELRQALPRQRRAPDHRPPHYRLRHLNFNSY